MERHPLARAPLARLAPLVALVALAAPALAEDETLGHGADLRVGPLIGGQELVFDLRTTAPNAAVFAFLGFSGQPIVPAQTAIPVVGVAASDYLLVATDASGRFRLELPTLPGQFGSALGLALFSQVLVVAQDGHLVTSRVVATEIEPPAPAPGYLVEDAATYLPASYANLGANHVETGDLDRDGWPDAVLALDADLVVWMNDGTGGFLDQSATRIAHPGGPVGALELGDVDADGDLDLVVAGGHDDFADVRDRLFLNDGAGVFALDASGKLPAGEGGTSRFELGDVDSDGDLDLAVANGPENHLGQPGGIDQLYRNAGDGTFVADGAFAAAAWNVPTAPTTALRFGDVDSDGDLDLFVCKTDTAGLVNDIGEPNLLLLNDGTGAFTDATATSVLPLSRADNTEDAVFADIDGDGDLDLVVANSVFTVQPMSANDVLINQGGAQGGTEGTFVDDPLSFLEDFDSTYAIRLSAHAGDLDADGDLDVLMPVHDFFLGAEPLLFLNQGGAQGGTEGDFVRQTWFDPGDYIGFDAALFDRDLDGDLDVLLSANGVLGGDPNQGFDVRLMVNTKL